MSDGSGALAGCSFPIDRPALAKELGFSRITANSLDAVSDRDFALNYLFALAGIATHLSRLAEDFVLFASQEFSYIILPDEYSHRQQLDAQKKNPDAWELLRGKTGRITAATFQSVHHSERLALQLPARLARRQRGALCCARSDARHDLGRTRRVDRNEVSRRPAGAAALESRSFCHRLRPITLLIGALPLRQAHDLVGKVAAGSRKTQRTNPGRNSRSKMSGRFRRYSKRIFCKALPSRAPSPPKLFWVARSEGSVSRRYPRNWN